jgi:hypothetical protein
LSNHPGSNQERKGENHPAAANESHAESTIRRSLVELEARYNRFSADLVLKGGRWATGSTCAFWQRRGSPGTWAPRPQDREERSSAGRPADFVPCRSPVPVPRTKGRPAADRMGR